MSEPRSLADRLAAARLARGPIDTGPAKTGGAVGAANESPFSPLRKPSKKPESPAPVKPPAPVTVPALEYDDSAVIRSVAHLTSEVSTLNDLVRAQADRVVELEARWNKQDASIFQVMERTHELTEAYNVFINAPVESNNAVDGPDEPGFFDDTGDNTPPPSPKLDPLRSDETTS